MDAVTLARALEPCFTTREGAGGMGLPAVDEIVREFGGTLRLESQPGQGTRAILTLPGVTQPAVPVTTSSEAPRYISGTEAILLVEDAERVRRLLVRVLEE